MTRQVGNGSGGRVGRTDHKLTSGRCYAPPHHHVAALGAPPCSSPARPASEKNAAQSRPG